MGLVPVGRTSSERQLREWRLLLRALGIHHAVAHEGRDLVLGVAEADAPRATAEIEQYRRENEGWPPPRIETPGPRVSSTAAVAYYVLLLATVHALKVRQTPFVDWVGRGHADAGLILDGQWWRCVTALCLHTDLVHLLGNLLFGSLFLHFACQALGSSLAAFSMLLAGAAGNALNAWLQPPDHASIGASTAVFGAIGVLAAHRWQTRRRAGFRRVQSWGPLAAALAFLGYLGTSGERTDVLAHITGLLAGLAVGSLYGRLGGRRHPGPRLAAVLALGTVGLLAGCWWAAFS